MAQLNAHSSAASRSNPASLPSTSRRGGLGTYPGRPGSISVQSDVQFTSSWLAKAEPVASSRISSSPSNKLDHGQSSSLTDHTGPSSHVQEPPEPHQCGTSDDQFPATFSYATAPRRGGLNELEPSIHPGLHSNSPLDSHHHIPNPGYLTRQPNTFWPPLTEAQAQQCVEEAAQELRVDQLINVFAEGDPWFPGSRVRLPYLVIAHH
jgi:hypothetical protein